MLISSSTTGYAKTDAKLVWRLACESNDASALRLNARISITLALLDSELFGAAAGLSSSELARELASLPQICLRGDRLSAYESLDLDLSEAVLNELRHGMRSLAAGESAAGARRFAAGAGRHGTSSTGE